MDHKLQELTEKLYNEGVVKGNQEANQILAKAEENAKQIIADAHEKAAAILADANSKSVDLEKNTQSELQLASKQMLSALEQEVVAFITGSIVEEAIQPAINDKEFIQKLIQSAVENWAPKQDLLVVVSNEDKEAVEKYFASKAKQLLNKSIKIEAVNKIKTGFQIGPADGSFKVSFTHEDFASFFKEFVRPKIVELLFSKK